MHSVEQVIEEVEDAFREVPLGKVTLHEAEALDACATDVERRAARELDRERDWRDVPDRAIRECSVAAPQDRSREGVRPRATGNEFRGIEYDVWRGTFRGFETNTGVE
jgi:hypothetical protein